MWIHYLTVRKADQVILHTEHRCFSFKKINVVCVKLFAIVHVMKYKRRIVHLYEDVMKCLIAYGKHGYFQKSIKRRFSSDSCRT